MTAMAKPPTRTEVLAHLLLCLGCPECDPTMPTECTTRVVEGRLVLDNCASCRNALTVDA